MADRRHSKTKRDLASPASTSSSIGKRPTGIAGLDETLRGGIPAGRTTVIFGGPGSGKTVLALQSLVNGARHSLEPGIFVALEEDTRRIVENARSFAWDIPALQKGNLCFVDARLRPDIVLAGKFDVSALLEGLSVRVRETGAKRLVFDGIDVLLTLLDDPRAERTELSRINEWLLRNQLTGIVTSKTMSLDPFALPRYEFLAYVADCALLLERRHEDVVSERCVSVLKYRGSAFSENKAPFVIGPTGVEVAEQGGASQAERRVTETRLSTGVSRLDTMLNGGYFRGASTLITGLPGTAKSSLSGAFIAAACRRRERTLYVSFDEQGQEAVRNLASVGIDLKPFVSSGQLRVLSALSLVESAEVQLMRIRSAIREQRAECVVVDPISALGKSSTTAVAIGALARFNHWAKTQGVTLVCTSLVARPDPHTEATALGVSTLCDNWIHLAYAQRGGERNRSLTIVKARGTSHSNQVRELILSDDGITLTDVYEAGGEVFMGSMRWEQENRQRDEERRLSTNEQKRRLELERARAELKARSEALERERELNQLELDEAKHVEQERLQQGKLRHVAIMQQRGADSDGAAGGSKPGGRRKRAKAKRGLS